MGMKVLQVPLHNVMLNSDLFQGQVAVGVSPALPIQGITLILGNEVAGGCVWADVPPPPPPVVSSVPLIPGINFYYVVRHRSCADGRQEKN
ncbi:hypothetical protein N1851_005866 [Merluccius polli]|uniref:Uncharacterized protein n=1 Tax=Merluccius polli TaxID=89951 RepID=A0AA47N5G8_MERPO|nr:hypothetical protein N1851_005866 [Merluccius polli]